MKATKNKQQNNNIKNRHHNNNYREHREKIVAGNDKTLYEKQYGIAR